MKNKKEYLIIGGSGSLGNAITELLLKKKSYKGIRIYSRSEFLQFEMKRKFKGAKNISYLLGDVRDKDRLYRAMEGADVVINAAAQKHVTASEENPIEAMKTNCIGAANVVDCAIDCVVDKLMHISTDKSVYPINLYGATKTVAEKLILHSSIYDPRGTMFSCCRYGNVIGSRGSIVPLFLDQAKKGTITLTHEDMTRFVITLPQVAKFILEMIDFMEGGEIFIPFMPSMLVTDIIRIIAGNCKIKKIGIQPGEKLHECLISWEESKHTAINRRKKCYIIANKFNNAVQYQYTSEKSDWVVSDNDFLNMLEKKQRIEIIKNKCKGVSNV